MVPPGNIYYWRGASKPQRAQSAQRKARLFLILFVILVSFVVGLGNSTGED